MKRYKAKTLDDYFESQKGLVTWKRGRALYNELGLDSPFDDGRYKAQLVEAKFSVPPGGYAQNTFRFVFMGDHYKDQSIEKVVSLVTPEGVVDLLRTAKVLGRPMKMPHELAEFNTAVTKRKPMVTLVLETLKEVQRVRVEEVLDRSLGESVPRVERKPKAETPAPEFVATPVHSPVKVEPPEVQIESAPAEGNGNGHAEVATVVSPAEAEFEVKENDHIAIRYLGKMVPSVRVHRTYEDSNELIVELPTKEKVLISGDDVTGPAS